MECNLQTIQNTFESMSQNGWDVAAALQWGFFFQSEKKENLDNVYEELERYEYRLVVLERRNGAGWMMHVQKNEILAPEKLHRRNISFNDLAEKYSAIYDGWDVARI